MKQSKQYLNLYKWISKSHNDICQELKVKISSKQKTEKINELFQNSTDHNYVINLNANRNLSTLYQKKIAQTVKQLKIIINLFIDYNLIHKILKSPFFFSMNFNPNLIFPSSADPNYYLYGYLNVLKNNLDFQLSRMIQLNQNLIMSQTCNQNSFSIKQEHNEDESDSNSQLQQKIKNSQNRCYRTQQQKSAQLQSFGDRNDTKNIPKNYGKAILTFIKKNSSKIRPLLKKNNVEFLELMTQIKRIRKKVNSIDDLRKMWGAGDEQNKVKKCIRILSFTFMRKHCLPYIFHSRVKNYATHIKYRKRIIEGLKKPDQFTNIKQY